MLNNNFYKWFGDSKVVDDSGNPLVVYHGTDTDFSVFNKPYGFTGNYFTDSKENAKYFSEYGFHPENAKIMPCYLKIENPFKIYAEGKTWKELQQGGLGKQIKSIANDKHYDGVIIYNIIEGSLSKLPVANDYIVFNSNQIKSIDNKGTWSDSENIYESLPQNINNNFWKWFGNSKLIENGEPMIFYHGTPYKFDTFDYEKSSFYSNLGQGFYFTPDENVAMEYLGGILDHKTSDSHIKRVYLRMEKPLYADEPVDDKLFNTIINCVKENVDDFWLKDIDMPEDDWYDEGILNHLTKEDILIWKKYARKTENHYNGKKNTYLSIRNNLVGTDLLYLFTDGYRNIRMKKHIQAALLKVYDGVIYDLSSEPKYVVFKPEQIKAVDNKGTWSTSSSNIYESLNRELERYI